MYGYAALLLHIYLYKKNSHAIFLHEVFALYNTSCRQLLLIIGIIYVYLKIFLNLLLFTDYN